MAIMCQDMRIVTAKSTAGAASTGRLSKPQVRTTKSASRGPMANPRLPPTEKMDIPVTFLSPVKKWAVRKPSGWYEAIPRPLRTTSGSTRAKLDGSASIDNPAPAQRQPSGSSRGFSLRSER